MTSGFSTISTRAPVVVADISDLTVANSGLDLLEQDAMSLQPMPLRARRVIVRLPIATVVYHSTNRRVRTRTRAQDGLLAYGVFGPRATGTVEGLEVRPGMMLVAAAGVEAGFIAEPGWESIALLVPPDYVRKNLSARRRDGEMRAPRGVEILRTDPARARALFRLGKRLTTAASRKPSAFDPGREERNAAQVELLEALLSALRSTDTLEPLGTERTRRAQSQVVTLAENYVLSRVGEHVRVSDLCRAADVSERTLERAFEEVTGLSPLAYLIRMRLYRVRAALLAAEPGSTRVSAEALKWGFWHFGEFSRAYKQCFGELPSATLRREVVACGPVRTAIAND